MSKDLHPELRMVAAILLFETKVPMGLVTSLANVLLKETNLQVASFVYSYMKAMTKNTAPDYASVYVLKYIKHTALFFLLFRHVSTCNLDIILFL